LFKPFLKRTGIEIFRDESLPAGATRLTSEGGEGDVEMA